MKSRNKPIAAFSIIELAITIVVSAVVIAALLKANSMFERVGSVGKSWQDQDYGSKQAQGPICSGGEIDITSVPGKVIHIFKESGDLICNEVVEVEYLIVGGGGGTRANGGGGGLLQGITTVPVGSNSIVVGAGGSPYSSLPYYPWVLTS